MTEVRSSLIFRDESPLKHGERGSAQQRRSFLVGIWDSEHQRRSFLLGIWDSEHQRRSFLLGIWRTVHLDPRIFHRHPRFERR